MSAPDPIDGRARPTICIDFDGCLSRYDGWRSGHAEPMEPIPGALVACLKLRERFNLVVLTSRDDHDVVRGWLARYGFPLMRVTSEKVPAIAYIDDRAIRFRGSWYEMLGLVDESPWWQVEGQP